MARPAEERFWEKVDQSGDCWLWRAATVSHMGYGHFWNGERVELAHRYSWRLANGAIPDGALILHACDVPRCVNPEHLYPGDHLQNARDKRKRGREANTVGSANGRALVNENDVAVIRLLWINSGLNQSQIGAMYGISRQAVSAIVRRERWADVAA